VQGTRPTLLLFCHQQSKLTIAKNLTFAHIGAAADLALMLWTAGINPAIQLKKTWTLPLGRIGNNFLKKVLKTFWLENCGDEYWIGVWQAEECRLAASLEI
jgi:hypothetical protein